jgi:hypothetical protein
MTSKLFTSSYAIVGLLALGACGGPLAADGTYASNQNELKAKSQHVLLLSIDGMHQFDYDRQVALNPAGALARLRGSGTQYTQATSSRPSDSFPGTLAMTTGGSPASTGIYYDFSWDDNLSPAGSDCSTRGAVIPFDGTINVDDNDVNTTIDPNKLPRNPDNGCSLVYPHNYLKTNTVFEVIHGAGMRTAVIDKHPAYELLNGPSGTGLDDFWGPENDANGNKKSIAKMIAYDQTKVNAVLHEIDGFDHTGTVQTGVPAIIMMNFQAVNIGEKVGGYLDAAGTPSAGLQVAMDFVDTSIGTMLADLEAQGLSDSTLVIVTAKHGDSPVDLSSRRAIDPALIDNTVNSVQAGLLAQETPDTISLIWLKDHSRAADVAAAIADNAATLGVGTIYQGDEITQVFGGALNGSRNRRPDVIIDPAPGVIYTTSGVSAKKVEHGGFNADNTHVPLVMSGPKVAAGRVVNLAVDLRQVAPTLLKSLGLDGKDLQAVRAEGTKNLPKDDQDSGD